MPVFLGVPSARRVSLGAEGCAPRSDGEFVLLSPVLLLLGVSRLNTFHSAEDYVRAAVWLLVRV